MKLDILSLTDLDCVEVEALADRAVELAEFWLKRSMPQTLAGSRIGLIEELPGWRNPTALTLGATSMGATCVPIGARLEGAEIAEDLAGYLDNWFDLLGIRTPSLNRLRSFAGAARMPVINLRTNDNHPCEVLGDLSVVLSARGSWDYLRVAMVGPRGNIAQSWVEAARVLPIEVVQIAPSEYAYPSGDLPANMSATHEIEQVLDANLIVTDCWPSDASDDERKRLAALRIDEDLLDRYAAEVLFVPCPPVTRGQEVTDGAMRHPRCMANSAKAFLLHVQNAAMERAVGCL